MNSTDTTKGNSGPSVLVRSLVVGPLATNCHILACAETRSALVVDPGFDADRILQVLDDMDVEVELILLTHGHVDHVAAVPRVAEATGAKVAIHDADRAILEGAPQMAAMFGLGMASVPDPEVSLVEGKPISVGTLSLDVIHTPGHTAGSLCFHLAHERILVAGDTLFYRGVGRTDLPGGSWGDLVASIQNKLYRLDGATQVLTGHGPATVLREEMLTNPFVRA